MKKLFLGLSVALGASAFATTALATDVSQSVTAGSLTANIANLTLPAATYSNASQTRSGTMVLQVADNRDTQAGWNVSIVMTAAGFVYSGSYTNVAIPSANFTLDSAEVPVMVSGQAVGLAAATGPQVPPTSPLGTLDVTRMPIKATAAYGNGSYTQDLGVTLTIPGQSRVGTYTGVLTVTASNSP
ncbi:MAG: WxL domain-containing protein [bacterium]